MCNKPGGARRPGPPAQQRSRGPAPCLTRPPPAGWRTLPATCTGSGRAERSFRVDIGQGRQAGGGPWLPGGWARGPPAKGQGSHAHCSWHHSPHIVPHALEHAGAQQLPRIRGVLHCGRGRYAGEPIPHQVMRSSARPKQGSPGHARNGLACILQDAPRMRAQHAHPRHSRMTRPTRISWFLASSSGGTYVSSRSSFFFCGTARHTGEQPWWVQHNARKEEA